MYCTVRPMDPLASLLRGISDSVCFEKTHGEKFTEKFTEFAGGLPTIPEKAGLK